jgi:hypothetical protein
MPSSINRNPNPTPVSEPPRVEPVEIAPTVSAEPYDPETDPAIIAAWARLKTDFISKLCGEGSTEPSGSYGPEVSIVRRQY